MRSAAFDRACAMIWLILIVTTFALVMLGSGCVETLTPETKAAIAESRNQAAIAAQKAKEAEAAAEAAAKAKPTAHPIEWANVIIQQIHGPILVLAWICTVATFVGVGLIVASYFATALGVLFATIGKLLAPIAFCVSSGCWATLFLLPWALWILLAGIVLAAGLLIWQLSRAHWSIAELFTLHEANAGSIKVNSSAIKTLAAGTPAAPLVSA